MSGRAPELSVIVPALNEEETLGALYSALSTSLAGHVRSWELVIVDDGSTDATRDVIAALHTADPRVNGIVLSRNFGQEAAIRAGMGVARGVAVVLMDADLQDSPAALPTLIAAWREGADVVYGVRKSRKEKALLRFAMSSYYRLAARTMSIDLPRDAGGFSLMSRRVVDALNAMPEHERYIPGLRAFVGFRQVAVPIERSVRHAGTSKYSFGKRSVGAVNALVAFSKLPLRLASIAGAVLSGLAVVAAIAVVIAALLGADVQWWWAALFITIVLIGGMQLIAIGLVGEYVGRVFDESRDRPAYFIAEEIPAAESDVPGAAEPS